MNSFYHYKLDGVWQLGEEKDAAVFGAKPGDLKINIPGMEREAEGKYYKVNDNGEKLIMILQINILLVTRIIKF